MRRPEVQRKMRKPRPHVIYSQARRKQIGRRFAGKIPKNLQRYGKFGNIIRGYFNINGKRIFLRSKWEANYALYLDYLKNSGQIKGWSYEPKTFIFEKIKFGTRSYTPDFCVVLLEGLHEWHEVKGWVTRRSATAMRRMKKYFPEETVVIIDGKKYRALLKARRESVKFFGPNDKPEPCKVRAAIR